MSWRTKLFERVGSQERDAPEGSFAVECEDGIDWQAEASHWARMFSGLMSLAVVFILGLGLGVFLSAFAYIDVMQVLLNDVVRN